MVHTKRDVIVFHDETKSAGKEKLNGHILLFIPIELKNAQSQKKLFETANKKVIPKCEIFSKICKIRTANDTDRKFHFKEFSGRKWTRHDKAGREIIEVGVDALRHKKPRLFDAPLCCKMAVMFFPEPTPDNLALYGGANKKEQKLRFFETTLRMLLKGATHYLYDTTNKINTKKIVTDGKPHHRELDDKRILERLTKEDIEELRDYVSIDGDARIISVNSNHKKHQSDSEDYIYANLLQLADMLLGSVTQACLKGIKRNIDLPETGDKVEDKKSIIAYPVKEMLDKVERGRNFEKSFAVSKAYVEDGEWKFEQIKCKEVRTVDNFQKTLPYFVPEIK